MTRHSPNEALLRAKSKGADIGAMKQVELCGSTPLLVTRSHPGSQWPLLLILSSVQFIHVLDFVILMPLGPQLMRLLEIGPQAFGLLVSAYNLAAAGAGLLGAFVLDRFDRKQALLLIFAGFALGTLGCAMAPGFTWLFICRIVTGAFGGLMQALVFTIVGDCFSEETRGAATGTVMSAFSVASVIGVPVGLSLAAHQGWRTPFVALAVLSVLIMVTATKVLPPLRLHLFHEEKNVSQEGMLSLIKSRTSLVAFALISSLMFAGFTIIPFISAYLVSNVGLSEKDLASVFFVGGVATFISSRFIGKAADRLGKARVFTWLAALSTIPAYLLTHLPEVGAMPAIIVTTLFTVLISARSIPALAMITSSVERARRGRFLSLTSSVQQGTSGLASLLAGALLGQEANGRLMHYDAVGIVSVFATFFAIFFARRLGKAIIGLGSV